MMDSTSSFPFLAALRRQPVTRTPVWIMRQAGRYLPEYRALREKAGNFMSLCRTPELACEATLQPVQRFDLDAAIVFSDILTIPDAMGLGLYFTAGEGPRFRTPVRSAADIRKLARPDPEVELRYVMDAVRMASTALEGHLPLIGFAGSPWTLATYMVEGGGSRNFTRAKAMLLNEPRAAEALLDLLAQSVSAYLAAQAAAGARALMIFDTWGGALTPAMFRRFSLQPMAEIVASLSANPASREVPVILFSKGAGLRLREMADTGCAALGVDWTVDLAEARKWVGDKVALQGNLDPAVMNANADAIRREVAAVLESYGPGPGHVFNLGHGITPEIEPEKVALLVDTVHQLSARN